MRRGWRALRRQDRDAALPNDRPAPGHGPGAAPPGKVRILGLDDWAWRRGNRYGTILVDLEAHRVLDLLPDRTAATAEAWLRAHPEIDFLSRDRSGEYATAARLGAPQAHQVTDRFHIIKNLGESLEHFLLRRQRFLHQAAALVAAAPAGKGPAATPASLPRPFPRIEREQEARRARRIERYEEVLAHQRAGMSQRAIARTMGLSRDTVGRFLQAETFPEQAPRHRPNQITAYEPYLRERWNAGEQNAAALWRELRAKATQGQARRYVAMCAAGGLVHPNLVGDQAPRHRPRLRSPSTWIPRARRGGSSFNRQRSVMRPSRTMSGSC